MKSKGVRRLGWAILVFVALAALAAGALKLAINQNGPAVLDTIDRITGPAGNIETIDSLSYGSDAFQKLIVQRPEGTTSDASLPVIVFIHGGSWKDGDPDDYGFVGRSLSPEGFVTVLAGYRLGEKGKFPAMLQDGATALAWVRAHISEYGGDPDNIVLMGHSAGAYNAAMLALDGAWLEQAGVPSSSIKGVVGLAGPYDFYPFDTDATRATFGEAVDPEVTQPINFDFAGAPPFLLIHGNQDTTVKPRNSKALADKLSANGVTVKLLTYPDMDHSAPLLQLASPWRGKTDMHEAVLQFIANPETSVPVQPETR